MGRRRERQRDEQKHDKSLHCFRRSFFWLALHATPQTVSTLQFFAVSARPVANEEEAISAIARALSERRLSPVKIQSGFPPQAASAPGEASIIGWPLQTKALIMIIFANILLDKQLITSETFTALLLMAVVSTMLTIPMVSPRLKAMKAILLRSK